MIKNLEKHPIVNNHKITKEDLISFEKKIIDQWGGDRKGQTL